MINIYVIANENNAEHNPQLPHILDHPYRTLIIGSFESGKNERIT